MYLKQHLENPAIIIDTNHSNSGKNALEQIRIAKEVFGNMRYENFNTVVKGLLVESYIEDGNQKPDGCTYGMSVTDPCLGWEKSARSYANSRKWCDSSYDIRGKSMRHVRMLF